MWKLMWLMHGERPCSQVSASEEPGDGRHVSPRTEVFYPSQPKPEAASACSFATMTKNTANQSFRQWLSFGEDGFW